MMDGISHSAVEEKAPLVSGDDGESEPASIVDRRAMLRSVLGGLAAAAIVADGVAAAETATPATRRTTTRSSRRRRTHVRFSVGPAFVEDFLKAPAYPLEVYNASWDDPRGANPHPKAQVRHAGVAKIWTGITHMTMLIPDSRVFKVAWADGRIIVEGEARGKLHWAVWHRFVFPASSNWHLTQRGSLDYTVFPTMSLTLAYDRQRRVLRPDLTVEKLRWKPGLLGRFVKKRDLEALVKEQLGNLALPLDMKLDIPIPRTALEQHYVTAQVADVDLAITPTGLDMNVALDFGWRSGT